jgi:hypothetical protein
LVGGFFSRVLFCVFLLPVVYPLVAGAGHRLEV